MWVIDQQQTHHKMFSCPQVLVEEHENLSNVHLAYIITRSHYINCQVSQCTEQIDY